jgi:hypothetical protein
MKWFDNWFASKCKQAWESAQNSEKEYPEDRPVPRIGGPNRRNRVGLATAGSADSAELQSQCTTFRMYQANGGTVIELRHYDEHKEQWESSLHVIPNGEELGKSIEHIITYEALKR